MLHKLVANCVCVQSDAQQVVHSGSTMAFSLKKAEFYAYKKRTMRVVKVHQNSKVTKRLCKAETEELSDKCDALSSNFHITCSLFSLLI